MPLILLQTHNCKQCSAGWMQCGTCTHGHLVKFKHTPPRTMPQREGHRTWQPRKNLFTTVQQKIKTSHARRLAMQFSTAQLSVTRPIAFHFSDSPCRTIPLAYDTNNPQYECWLRKKLWRPLCQRQNTSGVEKSKLFMQAFCSSSIADLSFFIIHNCIQFIVSRHFFTSTYDVTSSETNIMKPGWYAVHAALANPSKGF